MNKLIVRAYLLLHEAIVDHVRWLLQQPRLAVNGAEINQWIGNHIEFLSDLAMQRKWKAVQGETKVADEKTEGELKDDLKWMWDQVTKLDTTACALLYSGIHEVVQNGLMLIEPAQIVMLLHGNERDVTVKRILTAIDVKGGNFLFHTNVPPCDLLQDVRYQLDMYGTIPDIAKLRQSIGGKSAFFVRFVLDGCRGTMGEDQSYLRELLLLKRSLIDEMINMLKQKRNSAAAWEIAGAALDKIASKRLEEILAQGYQTECNVLLNDFVGCPPVRYSFGATGIVRLVMAVGLELDMGFSSRLGQMFAGSTFLKEMLITPSVTPLLDAVMALYPDLEKRCMAQLAFMNSFFPAQVLAHTGAGNIIRSFHKCIANGGNTSDCLVLQPPPADSRGCDAANVEARTQCSSLPASPEAIAGKTEVPPIDNRECIAVDVTGKLGGGHRNIVMAHGKEVLMPDTHFRCFLRLVKARVCKEDDGWVSDMMVAKEGLLMCEPPFHNPEYDPDDVIKWRNIISKLRAYFTRERIDEQEIIEGTSPARYRIKVTPDRIGYNKAELLKGRKQVGDDFRARYKGNQQGRREAFVAYNDQISKIIGTLPNDANMKAKAGAVISTNKTHRSEKKKRGK